MTFLQQIIQLLSFPPGNVIYHLVTLFTLQAVFGLAYTHWQRDAENGLARRTTWAAGSIFVARIIVLLAGLLFRPNLLQANVILPPLEQAVNTVTAVLLIWAFSTPPSRSLRLFDTLLVISLAFLSVMFLFFVQNWQQQIVLNSEALYNGSGQAVIWGILQMGILGAGLFYQLLRSKPRNWLTVMLVTILLAAHIAHFWNYPEIIPTDSNITYWIRLGHLITFPLWAILAYLSSITPLLAAEKARKSSTQQLRQTLQQAGLFFNAKTASETIRRTIRMVELLTNSGLVAVGIPDNHHPEQFLFLSNLSNNPALNAPDWDLNMDDWPTFQLAIHQQQAAELSSTGVGSQQLWQLYQKIGQPLEGSLAIRPLTTNGKTMGLMLVAAPKHVNWRDEDHELLTGLADFSAHALAATHPQEVSKREG